MGTNKSVEEEQCRCILTSGEMQVLKYIFETILKTKKAPTIREMRLALKKSNDYVIRTLDELEKKDILLRKGRTQEIVSVYPLSLTPTEHQIILRNETRLFAMCAVDALGMPIMFNKKAKIVSQCEKCKQDITIKIENEEIVWVSHPNIMIWSPGRQVTPAAEKCCPLVNFFCCKEHLEDWSKENSDLHGKTSEMKQTFPRIKQCWKLYGEALGFR